MNTVHIYHIYKSPGGDLRDRVMRKMGISLDDYYLMRYELAYNYFKQKGYLDDNIRLMVLSQTFWRWWNIQLDAYELKFLEGFKGLTELTPDNYEVFFMQTNIYPGWSVMRQIRSEGLAAMNRNKVFSNLKL